MEQNEEMKTYAAQQLRVHSRALWQKGRNRWWLTLPSARRNRETHWKCPEGAGAELRDLGMETQHGSVATVVGTWHFRQRNKATKRVCLPLASQNTLSFALGVRVAEHIVYEPQN